MIARMLEDNCISVPITMTKAVSQPPSLRKKYEHSRDSVTVMYQAGIPSWQKRIAMTNPIPPWTCLMGNPSIWNWNCWVEAGLSNVNALRAATSLPVECFGLTDRGAIEVGKRADLVLIGSDPLQNISATRDIRHVWCGGLKFEDES